MSIKDLVGKKVTKKVKFSGGEVVITKLTVAQVLEIQEMSTAAKDAEATPDAGLDTLKKIVRLAADGGPDLTDEDFLGFSIDELTNLSQTIMEFSGLGEKQGK